MHQCFLLPFSYKEAAMSSEILFPIALSIKRKIRTPSSNLKYHDSYAFSIN
jgi:hypothetical protein